MIGQQPQPLLGRDRVPVLAKQHTSGRSGDHWAGSTGPRRGTVTGRNQVRQPPMQWQAHHATSFASLTQGGVVALHPAVQFAVEILAEQGQLEGHQPGVGLAAQAVEDAFDVLALPPEPRALGQTLVPPVARCATRAQRGQNVIRADQQCDDVWVGRHYPVQP